MVFPPPPHALAPSFSLPGVAPPPVLPSHLGLSLSQPFPSSFPLFASVPPPSSLPSSTPFAASLSFPQPPVFRSAPEAPEFPFDDDPHNRSFDSDSPCSPPSYLSDYRWMLDFLLSLLPQARGVDLPPRLSHSLFESSVSGTVPPLPCLIVFDRISTALSEADDRLKRVVHSKKFDASLFLRRKSLYSTTGHPAEGKALPLNRLMKLYFPSLFLPLGMLAFLLRSVPLSRARSACSWKVFPLHVDLY